MCTVPRPGLEVGVAGEALQRRLRMTLGAFQLARSKAQVDDPGKQFRIARIGGQVAFATFELL
jgi:hypothetical protein